MKNTSNQSKEDISEYKRQSERSISEIQNEPKRLVSANIHDEPERNILDFTEDWMGLGKPKNKIKKSKYITKDPTILHCNDNSRTNKSVIGILRNESISELKSICIDNKHISLINTCTFDSISQVMFCSYADSENYRQFVENNIQHIFMELVSHTLRDDINPQSYRKRALFLKDLFTKEAYQYLNEITAINAACTAQFMLSKIFETFPSIIEQRACTNCLTSNMRHQISVLVNLPTENLLFLPDALETYGTDQILCKNCDLVLERKVEFKEHLLIEPAVPLMKEIRSENNVDLNIKLKDVTKILKIQDNMYYIRGIICFIPPASNHKNAIGHYIAYCYRDYKNIWEKYDDLTTKSKSVRPTTEAQKCQFLIYTI